MAASFPGPNSFVATTQASRDQPLIICSTSKNLHGGELRTSAGEGRAIGKVVLVAPTQVKHEVTSPSQSTQATPVPETGRSASVPQLAHKPAQFVVQPHQLSLIQTSGSATLQSLQFPKNVILLNRLTQVPVEQSTGGDPAQLITTAKGDGGTATLQIGDQKKRWMAVACKASNDPSNLTETNQETSTSAETVTIGGTRYLTSTLQKGLYQDNYGAPNAVQLVTSQGINVMGLQTLTISNANSGATEDIMQYAQHENGQYFNPATVPDAGLQAYQLHAGASTSTDSTESVIPDMSSQSPSASEAASQKREFYRFKNRIAAKECRRKKKEHIKCLEDRVADLENQNAALMEELKILKERYCQNNE